MKTCGTCYWWASLGLVGRNFLGQCCHREHPNATDRTETCDDHEPVPDDEKAPEQ